jgi:membrane fusion protein, copper/silver efflux system
MKTAALSIIAVLGAVAIATGGYWLGRGHSTESPAAGPAASAASGAAGAPQKPGDVDPATGRKVLYWHDPMVPGQRFDKPGKSPFMNMMLEPVYAGAGDDASTVTINPRVRQNIGVRTAEATRARLTAPLTAVGSVAFNERDQAVVQARANGFVEKLFVRAPLDAVRKGQPLLELYVPDWVAAQEEYLAVRRMKGAGMDALADGARQRMRLAGMSDEQIERIVATGTLQPRLTIVAPIGGVVTELAVREGMTVAMGAPLYRINGLGSVWINAELPESAAARVRAGTPVEVRTASQSGTTYKGRVGALLPEVNAQTRTVKARIEVANPGGQLVPGIYASVEFVPAGAPEMTVVPSEAVIVTGKRAVVFVAEGDGRFRPVDVEVGAEANGMTEIRKGVEPGQKIVVSGQFLIDSDASLKGTTTRLSEPAPAASAAPAAITGEHRGEGRVEKIARDEIMLSHDPIPSLKWGAMTMGFIPPAAGWPASVKVGDRISFTFRPKGVGEFEILTVTRAGTAPAAAAPAADPHAGHAPAAGMKP